MNSHAKWSQGSRVFLNDLMGQKIHGQGDVYRFFLLARNQSIHSDHRTKMGAVLTRRGVVINTGRNSKVRTHPESKAFSRSVHAELDAIIGIDRHHVVGGTMWVYRAHRDGSLALAKPCIHCREVLSLAGVRMVIYTTEKGFQSEKL